MLSVTLASLLALASPAPAGPPATSAIEAALVRGEEPLLAEVERALRVRLPSLTFVRQGSELPEGTGLRAFVELRRTSPTQVEVALILSDGRAYFRTVDTDAESPARPVAGALALLIAAIEDDSIAPDQRDVPVPPAIAAPEPTPKVAPPACPPVQPCPQPEPVKPPAPPTVELAPVLRSGAMFGLGPLAGTRGAMFGLGLDVRWRGGAMVAADVHAITAAIDGLPLSRARVAAGAGYALRRGAFELPIVGMVGAEWWGVPGAGEVSRRGPNAAIRPLIGGGLRLSPGVLVRVGAVRLRAGARVELWGSGEPGPGGLRQPVVARPGGAAWMGVGGAELSIGIELAIWIAGRRRQGR